MRHFVITVTNDGVSDRRMHRLAKLLRAHAWKVTIVGRVFETREPKSGYHFIQCERVKGPLAYWEYNTKLAKWLSKTPMEILCAVDVDTILALRMAHLPKKTKVIVDSHEYFEEVPELKGKYIKKWVWKKVARYGFHRADQCWTVSHELAAALENRYQRPFHVIPNYPSSYNLSGNDRQRVLVYLGVLNAGRGIEVLIKSMHDIDAKLWLLGEGDLSHNLRKLVKDEGLTSKVDFKGWIDAATIPQYLQKASVGINLLQKSSESYHLSLANKFFDYVHAGTPQICMSFPSYNSMLKTHQVGLTVEELDQDAFVTQCRRLLDDQTLWTDLHNQCLEARSIWTFDNLHSRILDLLRELEH